MKTKVTCTTHHSLPETRNVDFDVYLPCTIADPLTGAPLDSKFLQTVSIPVHGQGEEGTFLTALAHLIIEEVKLRHYFSSLPDAETFMDVPHSDLDGLTPNEAMTTHDGQRALICLAYTLGLFVSNTDYVPRRPTNTLRKP
jgi:hypothetical protein